MARAFPAVACLAAILTAAAPMAAAQIPGAIPDPGSYAGSMELQRREAESARAQEQQNAAMQERLNQNYSAYAPGGGGRGGGGRAGPPPINWWARPALAPAKNPLIGRWKQVASQGMTAQQLGPLGGLLPGAEGALSIVNGAMAGGCKSIFGTGVVAFTPTSLSWVAPDGHEEVLNHIAYRADGANVVVITRDPGAIEALFFGFPNHDHAVVALFNCTMDRVGAKATLASSTPAPAVAAPAAPASPANALLRLSVSLSAAPYAGAQVWVTPEAPDRALLNAGFPSGPFGAAAALADNCRAAQTCAKGLSAMTAHALGSVKTDAAGHAQTPAIPAGRYYLIGVVPFEGKALLWHYGVELQPGANTIALDDRTGSIIR